MREHSEPTIVVTGQSTVIKPQPKIGGSIFGALDYLSKPIREELLFEKLARLLGPVARGGHP